MGDQLFDGRYAERQSFHSVDPTQTDPLNAGFWLSLASQTPKSAQTNLKDGQGHSWPEYGSGGEQMVLFGDVEGGAAKVVPGDYYEGVYMCDSEEEE